MAAAPGWYDDGTGTMRYWDGAQWTQHVAPQQKSPAPQYAAMPAQQTAAAPVAATAAIPGMISSEPAKKRRVGLWVGLGVGGFLLLVAGGIAALVFVVVKATSGPRDAYAEMVDALRAQDCPAVFEHMHPDYRGDTTVDEACSGADFSNYRAPNTFEYSIRGTSTENNRTGTVRVVETSVVDGVEHKEELIYSFENVDGAWLVTDIEPAE